jgi:hypothetical protein
MAVFRKLLRGTNYCLWEFLKVTPKQNFGTAKSSCLFTISPKYNINLSLFS